MGVDSDFDPGLDSDAVATAFEDGLEQLDSDERRRLAEQLLSQADDGGGPIPVVAQAFVAFASGAESAPDDGVAALSDRVTAVLPEGSSFRDAAAELADGEADELIAAFEAYREPETAARLERLPLGGWLDPEGDESPVEAVRTAFGVDSTDRALSAVRDLAWLLTDAEIHETALERLAEMAGRAGVSDELEARHRRQLRKARQATDALARAVESDLHGGLKRQGFVRLNPLSLSRASAPDPETCWRTGFDLKAVDAGYAYERESVVDDLVESLRSGDHRLVVGRAGSGKSTVCKAVATRWNDREDGPVVYRPSKAETDFDDGSALLEYLREASGHVLVVVEDAVRHSNQEVFEALERFEGGEEPSASFLLESRRTDIDGLGRQLTDDQHALAETVHELRGSDLLDYEVPSLDDEECEAMVEHFERITDQRVVESADALVERTRRKQGVGGSDVIHFAYHLVRSSEGFETGLEKNVEEIYDRLDDPDELSVPDATLPARVGLTINVLKAANVPIHRELLYTLSDDHDAVEAVVQAVTGELLFESRGSAALDTNHELWASLYVRTMLEKETSETAHERFARCVNDVFSILDPETRQEIERQVERVEADADRAAGAPPGQPAGDGGLSGGRAYLSAVLPAAKLVEKLADLGRRWPVLAPLYGTTDSSEIELPEVCSPMTVANFVAARGDMYRNAGDLDVAMDEYRAAKRLIERSDGIHDRHEQKAESAYYNNMGDVALDRGDFEEARSHYERALSLSRNIQYRSGEAESLAHLGDVAFHRDEYENATDYYEDALALYREVGDRHEGARCLKNLGLVAKRRYEYEEANRLLERSLSLYREIEDRQGEAGCLNNLGLVADARDDLSEAQELYRRGLEIYREIGDRYGESISLTNLGVVAREQGDFDEAERYHSQSLDIVQDIGDRYGEAKCLDELGLVALERGEYETAEERFERGREINRDAGDRTGQAHVLRNLGTLERERGNLDDAESYHRESIELFSEIGNRAKAADSRRELGEDARERGDYRTAFEEFERACETFDEIETGGADGIDAFEALLDACERLGEEGAYAEWFERGREFAEAVGRPDALDGDGEEAE